jgi:MFS family permease
VLDDAAGLATILFIPASLGAFVTGLLLVLDGPWSWDQLWIVLGLAGFAATFLTGLLVIKPRSEKLAAIVERDGGLSPEALVGARQLLIIGRSDYVVLFLVVADMVLKPTKDDVGTLVAMAAILAAGIAYVVVRARAAGAREQPA